MVWTVNAEQETRGGYPTDGIPEVPQCDHLAAGPNHPSGTKNHLPTTELQYLVPGIILDMATASEAQTNLKCTGI